MTSKSSYWFLSRPRRFGKSLLVDTLHELFIGSESLFRGLHIHDHWDWNTRYPVIRLSFGEHYSQTDILHDHILEQLYAYEVDAEIEPSPYSRTGGMRLQHLIRRLHNKTRQPVVILVDEYDKPILDGMERGDDELARANRDTLRGFYGIIKDCARHIRFVFITGVSQFSKVSLFSELNNLNNINFKPDYAAICGYTEQDLETVFAPELAGFDRQTIREWYNGYHWLGEEKVYNPFDVLLLFDSGRFRAHWFETGTPRFLFEVLLQQEFSFLKFEHLEADTSQMTSLDVGDMGVEALLFQAGYLTIMHEAIVDDESVYTLAYPNRAVKRSCNPSVMG